MRDNSRVPYKLGFLPPAVRGGSAPAAGAAARARDGRFQHGAPPDRSGAAEGQHGESGFLPEERAELDRWIEAGWIDTFRRFEPGPGHYTWWSQRIGVRQRNIGWRIDYVLASPSAAPFLRGAFIHPHVHGSDHCPVGVDVDGTIFG